MSVNQLSTSNYQLFSDYHTHPQGHRVQRYTPALLQPWADSARKFGLTDIAFTDHDRYHAGIDFDEIDRLRERNPDLRIRAGIELDNDPIYVGRPAENGLRSIGTNSILSWARCTSLIVTTKCSIACQMARNNSKAMTSMRFTPIICAVFAKWRQPG